TAVAMPVQSIGLPEVLGAGCEGRVHRAELRSEGHDRLHLRRRAHDRGRRLVRPVLARDVLRGTEEAREEVGAEARARLRYRLGEVVGPTLLQARERFGAELRQPLDPAEERRAGIHVAEPLVLRHLVLQLRLPDRGLVRSLLLLLLRLAA